MLRTAAAGEDHGIAWGNALLEQIVGQSIGPQMKIEIRPNAFLFHQSGFVRKMLRVTRKSLADVHLDFLRTKGIKCPLLLHSSNDA
jgi:hypothetical protein